MNPLHTLPVPVIPISKDGNHERVLGPISEYLIRNPAIFKAARNPSTLHHAVRMAAHANRLWCVKWTDPETKKWLLVVVDKHGLKSEQDVHKLLVGSLAKNLANWLK